MCVFVCVCVCVCAPLSHHSVKGHQYFECQDKFGSLVRPSKLKVGDFPPEDEMVSSDSDSDDEDVMTEL
jgi:hypothetical protein